MLMIYRQSIYLCQKDLFQSDPSGLLPSILQVIKGLNEEQKKMENLVRLRILSIDVFNFILFLQSNSAISDLKYHSYEPLNFSEMKIVTPLLMLLLALVEVVFCTFIR